MRVVTEAATKLPRARPITGHHAPPATLVCGAIGHRSRRPDRAWTDKSSGRRRLRDGGGASRGTSLPPACLQGDNRRRLYLTKSKSRRAAARTHELPARCFLAEHRKLGRFHTGSEHRRRTDHHVPAAGKRMEHLTSPSVALAPCGEQSVFAALGCLDEPCSYGASFTRRASTISSPCR